MRSRPPSFGDVFELQVSLRDIEPPILRRLRVPADVTLGVLHQALQLAFGWQNSHLHDFEVAGIRFTAPYGEDEHLAVDENAAPLGAVAREGAAFTYLYDFGDHWEHEVVVARVTDGDEIIVCTGGERACPPEDCGGVSGYEHLLEVLADPKHEEHRDMKEWAPRGFNPEKFDLNAVNKKLTTLSKRLSRHRR